MLAEAGDKFSHPVLPAADAIGIIGGVALAANVIRFALLYRHRDDYLNLSSTWVCSRNDLIANSACCWQQQQPISPHHVQSID